MRLGPRAVQPPAQPVAPQQVQRAPLALRVQQRLEAPRGRLALALLGLPEEQPAQRAVPLAA